LDGDDEPARGGGRPPPRDRGGAAAVTAAARAVAAKRSRIDAAMAAAAAATAAAMNDDDDDDDNDEDGGDEVQEVVGVKSARPARPRRAPGGGSAQPTPATITLRLLASDKREVSARLRPTDTLAAMFAAFTAKAVQAGWMAAGDAAPTFLFDGDPLTSTDTPAGADMEDGCCVDVYFGGAV